MRLTKAMQRIYPSRCRSVHIKAGLFALKGKGVITDRDPECERPQQGDHRCQNVLYFCRHRLFHVNIDSGKLLTMDGDKIRKAFILLLPL